ncbi:MAG: TatD family hydrolase [Cytophagales bacterium]|nr:TatD family hydrolase [Cytophagales bacterium]
MIDTHAHIYLEEFAEDVETVIQSAKDAGVTKILMPNIDSTTTEDMMQLVEKYPETCYPMMGLHPCSAKIDNERELKHVEKMLNEHTFIAVGEIGTDLYWDKTFWSEQQEAFNIQCELALMHNLPIVIHCRETIDETIELVNPWVDKGLNGVFHCFGGSVEQGEKITKLGFYLGIGGISTFKNGGIDKVIPFLDKSKVLLETDSPYLSPVPHRGKRNEPAYIKLIAERIAELWETSLDEVDSVTTMNTERLFKL